MSTVIVNNVLSKLPPYEGKERLIKRRQDTHDIIRDILKVHERTAAHYDSISQPFWKGNARSTAANLFSFMKSNVGYVVEPTNFQSVKTPAAILAEGKQYGGDCKHYASFIVGVAEALRRKGFPIKAYYRFASYEPNKRHYGHVFAVVVDDQGREYWTDPVLSSFDQRNPQPTFFQNKVPPAMNRVGAIGELYEISGVMTRRNVPGGVEYTNIPKAHWLDTYFTRQPAPKVNGAEDMGAHGHHGGGHHFHRGFRGGYRGGWGGGYPYPVATEVIPVPVYEDDDLYRGPVYDQDGNRISGDDIGKAKKKKDQKKHKHHLKVKPGKLLKKFGGATPRNAFLALTKLNFMSLGTKMNAAIKDAEKKKKLWDWWNKLGGNTNKLSTAIHNGVATYNKLHHKHEAMNGPDDMSGAFPEDYMQSPFYMAGIDIYSVSGYEQLGFIPEEMRNMDSVGFAPAAIPALLAAAAPIIAAAKNILKSFGVDVAKLGKHAEKADADVADTHNMADDSSDKVNDDGSVDHGGGVTTKVTSDGKGGQQMEMSVKDPTAGGDAGDKDEVETETGVTKKSHGGDTGLKAAIDSTWSWIKDHKTYFFIAGGLIATIVIIKMVRSRGPVKRRR